MTRDQITRMDVDTGWAYHRRVRRLQAAHPDRWPLYWTAYLALLGEAWQRGHDGRRLTLMEAWCPALRIEPEEAQQALMEAGIIDRQGRIPAASWREWVEPTIGRLEQRREAGRLGALKRWHGAKNGGANGEPLGSQYPSQPSQAKPANRRGRTREGSGPHSIRSLLPPPPGYEETEH